MERDELGLVGRRRSGVFQDPSTATLALDESALVLPLRRRSPESQGPRALRMSYVSILLVAVGLLIAVSIVWTTLRVGISPMPSSAKATRAVLELIPATAGGRFVELGSGWGRLALAVTSQRPDAHVVAYELSLLPWLWSIGVARLTGRRGVEFLRRDFFDADLGETDVVLCYLYPDAMERLARRLTQLRPGSVIISNTFRLPGWQPDEVVELDDLYRTRIYRYVVEGEAGSGAG